MKVGSTLKYFCEKNVNLSREFKNCSNFEEAKRIYLKLAKKYHPDVYKDEGKTFRELNEIFKEVKFGNVNEKKISEEDIIIRNIMKNVYHKKETRNNLREQTFPKGFYESFEIKINKISNIELKMIKKHHKLNLILKSKHNENVKSYFLNNNIKTINEYKTNFNNYSENAENNSTQILKQESFFEKITKFCFKTVVLTMISIGINLFFGIKFGIPISLYLSYLCYFY